LSQEAKVHGFSPETGYALAAFAWAGAGAICDLRTRRIPNWLTGSGMVAGMLMHGVGNSWRGAASAGAGGLLAGGIFLLFYLAGGMGAGDVKLVSAVCALAGLGSVAAVLLGTALLGGLFALALALANHRLGESLANVARLLRHHASQGLTPHSELNLDNSRTLRLPYGLAIAAGAASSLCGVLLR
jgi:prepilin peptidase CpaA